MLDKYLIEHCAPTLACLKTANLFCVAESIEFDLENQLKVWNKLLEQKGLFLMQLRRQDNRSLIYICRSSSLLEDLQKPGVKTFLAEQGYENTDIHGALKTLKEKMEKDGTFPHEIGIFLGYPLGDVIGFIQNKGKNSICTGFWKVYCDEWEAIKCFTRFRKCREIYKRLWSQGKRSVMQLTVAA